MSGKYGGGLTALLNREREKKVESVESQKSKPQGTEPRGTQPQGDPPQGIVPQGDQPQGAEPQGSQPQGAQPPASSALAPPAPLPHASAPPRGRVPRGPGPQGSAPRGNQPQGQEPQGEHPVEWKNGELRIPNWIVFNFYPRLPIDERVVWEELYLWTHGFGENPRHVSQIKVAERLSIDTKRLRRIIARLETKGYVTKIEARHDGANDARGTVYDVKLPTVIGAPARGTQPQGTRPQGGQPRGARPPHEREEKENMKGPAAVAPAIDVFQIRTIAARIFEAHRGDLGFDHERLRQLVVNALIGQGMTPNAELVDEAIRGMGDHT